MTNEKFAVNTHAYNPNPKYNNFDKNYYKMMWTAASFCQAIVVEQSCKAGRHIV